MRPKFKNTLAWEQAERLMQPAFIRVIDNIGKQLEGSPWQGTYQEVQTPYPGYHLCLTHQGQSIKVDIWQLCFQVCLLDYPLPFLDVSEVDFNLSRDVEVDTSLINEKGEVDWRRLETKAQRTVQQIFTNLPQ